MKKLIKVLASIAFIGIGDSAVAATIVLQDGDIACESRKAVQTRVGNCNPVVADFSDTAADSVFSLDYSGIGSSVIHGFVRGTSDNLWANIMTLSGAGSYVITITLGDVVADAKAPGMFDAFFDLDQIGSSLLSTSLSGEGASSQLTVDLSQGDVILGLDASGGAVANGSAAFFSIDVVAQALPALTGASSSNAVSPVPLPASGLLFLAGFGALSVPRLRQKIQRGRANAS